MNKYSMLVFILILSLILPFFPCFSYVLMADNNISVSVNVGDYDSWSDGIRDKSQAVLGRNGYVDEELFYDSDSVHDFSVWDFISTTATNLGFTEDTSSGKSLPEQLYDYSIQNNIDIDSLINDNDLVNYADSYCPYYIYTTYHSSDFNNLFQPRNDACASWLAGFNLSSLPSDSMYMCYGNTDYYRLDGNSTWGNHHLICVRIPFEFLDTYSFYAWGDTPESLLGVQFDNATSSSLMSHYNFWCASMNGIPNNFTFDYYLYYSTSKFSSPLNTTFGQVFDRYYCSLPLSYYDGGSTYCLSGAFFIVPDSVPKKSFLFFKSYNDYFSFYSGTSPVYKFDSDYDLSKYPGLNYDKLYDIISTEVGHSTGNLLDAINGISNEFLAQQIELLHDINNALNNGNGQSWLRLIYDLLDFNLPLIVDDLAQINDTLQGFDFSNIGGGSVSGGSVSVDMTETNSLLSDINTKLGLMIGGNISTDTPTSLASLAESASTRFPFSLVTDVVVIVAILNHDPVKPDLQMPVPFQPGETWTIDISSYEYLRPYIQGFLIFGFILILIRLSMKILEALK